MMVLGSPRSHRTAVARGITQMTGLLTIQGELEPDGVSPDVGFLVKTSIPIGVPLIVRARSTFLGANLRLRALIRNYIYDEPNL